MKTINELKKAFTVKEWTGVCFDGRGNRSGGKCIAEYLFTTKNKKLYVSGNVFGKTKYEVLNPLEVYFAAAKAHTIKVKLDGLEFDIWSPTIE